MNACRVLLLAGALAMPALVPAVDLKDEFGTAIDQGISSYDQQSFDIARDRFHDAAVLKPGAPQAALNLGLAEARLGNYDEAERHFRDVLEMSSKDPQLRAEAYYNMARAQLDAAHKAMEDPANPDRKVALEKGFAALDSASKALAEKPDFEDAAYNRAQVQHFLRGLAQEIPPQPQSDGESKDPQDGDDQQQQQQPSGGSQSDQQDKGEQNPDGGQQQTDGQQQQGDQKSPDDQSQGEQQKGDQPDDPKFQEGDSGEKQQPTDKNPGQQGETPEQKEDQKQPPPDGQNPDQDGQPQDQDPQEGQGGGAGAQGQQSREMTPEEARALLNLLGNRAFVPMQDGRRVVVTPETKTW